jgi:ABC-2 type transport system permease protein
VALLGLALRSRVGAVGAGVANGLILALLGQIWVVFVALGESGGVPPAVSTIARYLPSGWGVAAVEAAASADWGRSAAVLAAMAVLVALLLAGWAALLTRRTGSPRTAPRGRAPMRATPAHGAVLSTELRTWSRDLVRTHQLTFALAYGVFFAAAPLLIGIPDMLPLAGPIFVVMAAAMSANLYGTDGTALWLTVMTPGATDVRGRQHAWLLTVAPVAAGLTVALTAAVDGSWPVMITLLVALLGGGAGLIPLMSVYALVPGTDPHRRGGNPLRSTEEDGAAVGMVYALLALVAVTAVPATVTAVLTGWPGLAVAAVTGWLCYHWFGLLAERRLLARGPELLETMRTGRRPAVTTTGPGKWTRYERLPRRAQIIVGVCYTIGAIPLFPQGVVPAVIKLNGADTRAWFLAMYLPPGLQWPTIVFMIALGLAIYATGVIIPFRHKAGETERRDGERAEAPAV